jgi:hypothetical protein
MTEGQVSDLLAVHARTLKHRFDNRRTQINWGDVFQTATKIANCGSGRCSYEYFTHGMLLKIECLDVFSYNCAAILSYCSCEQLKLGINIYRYQTLKFVKKKPLTVCLSFLKHFQYIQIIFSY